MHLAKRVLEGKGESLEGKRCLITGSGKMALHVAEKLLEFEAVPITLSDTSGHIYEPDGIDAAKVGLLCSVVIGSVVTTTDVHVPTTYPPTPHPETQLKTILKIKSERGARIGRYIIASTTAKVRRKGGVGSEGGLVPSWIELSWFASG